MGERPSSRPLYTPYRVPSGAISPPLSLATSTTTPSNYNASSARSADPLIRGPPSYGSEPSGSNSDHSYIVSPPLPDQTTTASEDAEATLKAGFIADRSCDRCRSRRVRCGREHPECARCLKGNQPCVYPPQTELKTADEPRSRVADLEAKLAIVQKQLKTSQQQQATSSATPSPSVPQFFGAPPPSPSFSQQVFDALFPIPSPDQLSALARLLVAETSRRADLSFHSIDARLASAWLAVSLTVSLIDAAATARCSEMPALQILARERTRLKATLHDLRPIDQAIVGAPGVSIDDPPNRLLDVAHNRERACRALEKRASDLASSLLFEEPTWEHLTVLCGFAQLLSVEDVRPTQARVLMRHALGYWTDLRFRWSPGDRDELLALLGESLMTDDALMAARSSLPLVINEAVLQEDLAPLGVRLPDFEASRLAFVIDSLLNGQGLARETLAKALSTTSLWVARCFRTFASIISRRSTDINTTYHRIRLLYSYIDEIHASLQRLQQIVINLSQLPPQHSNHLVTDHRSLEALLARALRQDLALIQLIFHLHAHLEALAPSYDPHGDLPRARHESEWRVRLALKRSSFCANLLTSCTDKHMLWHLVQTLDVLANWPHVVCQRAGVQGGPISANYEANPQELAWLRRGLEIAIFFTPRAAPRLNELSAELSRLPPRPASPLQQQARPQSSIQYGERPSTAPTPASDYDLLYEHESHDPHPSHGYAPNSVHPRQQQQQQDSHFLDPRHIYPPAPPEAIPDSSGSGETGTDDSSSKET